MMNKRELEMEIEMEYDLLGGYQFRYEQYKQMLEDIGEDEELFNTMLEYRSRIINSIKRIDRLENKLKEIKK